MGKPEPVDTDRKTFEHALFAAFKAGIALGAGYEETEAIPLDYRNLRWRAFRDAWAGESWDPPRWNRELQRMNERREARRGDTPLSFAARMGHPGGHYGN